MKILFLKITCYAYCIGLLLQACQQSTTNKTKKNSDSDPFKSTLTPSEYFVMNADSEQVLEATNGTLIVCPKNCFLYSNGDVVSGSVKIELTEALTMDNMVLSNLTTVSNGKLLETAGMIYFNVTTPDGEQLQINPDQPVYIRIPTNEKNGNMMVYEGIRDENGNMKWVNPRPIDNYLTIIPLDSLNFLPKGFAETVERNLPFKHHTQTTPYLLDSLYYSLSFIENLTSGDSTDILTKSSSDDMRSEDQHSTILNCGIDPAIIKVLKTKRYQNTLIATREFEQRLSTLFKSCNSELLELYIQNLDKNMYEIDSLAMEYCELHNLHECAHAFDRYYKLKQTKVKEADRYALLLKNYFDKALRAAKNELNSNRKKMFDSLKKETQAKQKIIDNYKKLLWKREKYNKEAYGFKLTKTGWINIDVPAPVPTKTEQKLEVTVSNGNEMDRVYTYIIYTSIKSLYKLNSLNKTRFYVGNQEDKETLMLVDEQAIIVSIGYKKDEIYYASQPFQPGKNTTATLTLSPSSEQEVKKNLREEKNYAEENKIMKDLEYEYMLYEIEQKEQKRAEERVFMRQLELIANPCCQGEILFNNNCISCHRIDKKTSVGPDLKGATSRHSKKWLYQFTTNSQALIASGDIEANNLFVRFGKSPMTSFSLTESEVDAIFRYIDDQDAGQ